MASSLTLRLTQGLETHRGRVTGLHSLRLVCCLRPFLKVAGPLESHQEIKVRHKARTPHVRCSDFAFAGNNTPKTKFAISGFNLPRRNCCPLVAHRKSGFSQHVTQPTESPSDLGDKDDFSRPRSLERPSAPISKQVMDHQSRTSDQSFYMFS